MFSFIPVFASWTSPLTVNPTLLEPFLPLRTAEMPASFIDEESESKEFLIEHRLAEKKTPRQWGFLLASLAILAVIGMIELIVLAIIFGQLKSQDHTQPLLSELNHLVPTCSLKLHQRNEQVANGLRKNIQFLLAKCSFEATRPPQ